MRDPVVIIEVLSKSTEGYDRGQKWVRYQHLESLKHYVLIMQDEPQVEVYTREADGGWYYKVWLGIDAVVPLTAIDVNLSIAEVFDGIDLGDPSNFM